jgi:hypothetical protein
VWSYEGDRQGLEELSPLDDPKNPEIDEDAIREQVRFRLADIFEQIRIKNGDGHVSNVRSADELLEMIRNRPRRM